MPLPAMRQDLIVERTRDLFARAYANDAGYLRAMPDDDLADLLEARDAGGRTPLMVAAFQGCREAADILILRGASLSAADPDGQTAYRYLEQFGAASLEQTVRMSVREAMLHTAISRARANTDPAAPATGLQEPAVAERRRPGRPDIL